jgi:hypothetical protein
VIANSERAGERALSIVVACDGAIDRIPERLDALARACDGLPANVIVVHDAAVRVVLPAAPPISTTIMSAPSALVPVLWGRGMAEASGRIVALTTTQFRVQRGWARALLAPFEARDVAGVGGRMALAPDASMLERAVFLIRYSEHMAASSAHAPRDIAGDNAAYRKDAVLAVCPNVADGFWEVDAHRLMRAAGARFVHAPDAVAEFTPALSLREMMANRFVHGSHYGAYRVSALRWPRWRALAVTPLVPAVLLARIFGRVRRAGQPLGTALMLTPAMVPLLIAWAAGEARGALSDAGGTHAA